MVNLQWILRKMQWLLCINIVTRNDKVAPNLCGVSKAERNRVVREKEKESVGSVKLDIEVSIKSISYF